MIKGKNYQEIIKKIMAKKDGRVAVLGRDIKLNRKILENKKVNSLILQHKPKKDRLKQRESGLNEVLCKIAKKNNVTLIINLEELKRERNKQEKSKILSRIIQNLRLIMKFKNKFKIINYKNKSQARSFLLTLGLPTDMTKKSVE